MARITPAQQARERAGYTLESAAKALGYKSPRRWKEIEARGGASMKIAERAGRLFGCSGTLFLFSPQYFSAQSTSAQARPTAHGSTMQGQPALPPEATDGADTHVSYRIVAPRRYRNGRRRVCAIRRQSNCSHGSIPPELSLVR